MRMSTKVEGTGKKRKRLQLEVFGKIVKIGRIESAIHTDVRTMLLKYCREAREKGRYESIALSAEREAGVEKELCENGEDVKSLKELRDIVQKRYNTFSVSAESVDSYYSTQRAEGYTKHNEVPQKTLSIRCAELSGKIKKNALILDCACGSGLSSEVFSRNYGYVIGCDVSSAMLIKASKEREALDYVRTDISQPMPFRPNVFDTAFSVSAIHYLASDIETRSAKARMGTFFRELRRTTIKNSKVTCQFHEKKNMENTHNLLQNAAKEESWIADLVLDRPHRTNAQRWFLCLSNRRSSYSNDQEKYCCPTCWPKNAMCTLMYSKYTQTSINSENLKWHRNEHVKYARRLIRCVNRHIETPEHPHLPKLSNEEKQLGIKLRNRFCKSVDLKALQDNGDVLIDFLHTAA